MTKILKNDAELTLSVIPLPQECNMQGAVFGGWTLQQLDLAGSVPARRITQQTNERCVTKAVNHIDFIAPIEAGDKVNFYTQVANTGTKSIVIHIHVEAERYANGEIEAVAEAEFVYVRLPALP